METDDSSGVLPFQLQFDKPIASQVKIAEWNPEKDLLAMVTEDCKLLLHRFNWQRLWTISPGKRISSICWRPDGKAIAVGLEDGTVALHDVENGKLLRSLKSHSAVITCLNWEEDSLLNREDNGYVLKYEDRTYRFFPPAPRIPRIPGLISGDGGFMDEDEDTFQELSDSSHQRFNILCSGDKDGNICFSIFGIFHIGKINIHNLAVPTSHAMIATQRLGNASICKVSLSKDLCQLIVVCSGELVKDEDDLRDMHLDGTYGLHSLALDTSIFWSRKNELHQMAQQASNIEDLIEVMRASLSVMSKQWSDAFLNFQGKFKSLSTLIVDNGVDSSPQEEFLSLLDGARPSPPLHQFLVNSLGEAGVKRVSKVICSAGKELQQIVLDHLQPAAEIIAFRIGELRALSSWRARFQGVGLDEKLINNATERAGMLLVQIERYIRVLSSVVQQFSNFFNWLLKCIKLLMSEPSDQVPSYSSELVVIFLKFLYDQDPVSLLLDVSEDFEVEIDSETEQRVRELVKFGGFSDTEYLRRTLAKEFQQMEFSLKEAFLMPFNTISKKLRCEDLLPLFPLPVSQMAPLAVTIPISVSCYEDVTDNPNFNASQNRFVEYMSFAIPDDSFSVISNCMGLIRGFTHERSCVEEGSCSLEAVLLCIPVDYECVDLSLYKDTEIVLLLNKVAASEGDGSGCIVVLDTIDLPFRNISRSACLDLWKLQELKDSLVHLHLEDGKLRTIPHTAVAPLAVSASRGVACVFTARKRALVYILEEDEDEISDAE